MLVAARPGAACAGSSGARRRAPRSPRGRRRGARPPRSRAARARPIASSAVRRSVSIDGRHQRWAGRGSGRRRATARSRRRRRARATACGSSSSHTLTRSSGCDVGGTSSRSSSATTPTASRIAPSSLREALDLLVGQREPREPRDVQHLVSGDRHRSDSPEPVAIARDRTGEAGALQGPRDRELPVSARLSTCVVRVRSARCCRHVRGLGTLGTLDDLELHTLALGEGLEAVHRRSRRSGRRRRPHPRAR